MSEVAKQPQAEPLYLYDTRGGYASIYPDGSIVETVFHEDASYTDYVAEPSLEGAEQYQATLAAKQAQEQAQ